jgi:hypothetical protein
MISSRRPDAIHRAAVVFDTPHANAAWRTEPPGMTTVERTFRGRPRRFPCALARCKPASTRSAILDPSNSVIAAKICI